MTSAASAGPVAQKSNAATVRCRRRFMESLLVCNGRSLRIGRNEPVPRGAGAVRVGRLLAVLAGAQQGRAPHPGDDDPPFPFMNDRVDGAKSNPAGWILSFNRAGF